MKDRRFAKRKLAAVIACGGMLAGLEPCIPDNFLYNLAAQSRDSLASNLAQFVSDSLSEALLPGFGDTEGDAP